MTAAERLERAAELVDQACDEITAAEPDAPPYSIESLYFVRTELRVTKRRLTNAARVLRGPTTPA